MSLDQFLQYLTWGCYLLLFLVGLLRVVYSPERANIDIALLFTAPALIITIAILATVGVIVPGPLTNALSSGLLLAMAYLLLRLVDDFAGVPQPLMRGAEAGLVLLVLINFVLAPPRPILITLLEVIYLVALLIYSTVAIIGQSRRASGVTRRRMQAIAAGSLALVALMVYAIVALFLPGLAPLSTRMAELIGTLSGLSYFVGFATPGVLRRAWQEPELRGFLSRAASLPRLPDTAAIVRELELGAKGSLGASNALIGLWDAEQEVLRFSYGGRDQNFRPDPATTSGRAFLEQRPVFTPDVRPDYPLYTVTTAAGGVKAILAAPITADQQRLGVLTVYSARAPLFADEDLELVKLLADQAAVILESRALIDAAARVQAREEVARLKEDFLSAAAHDLKTPLTVLVAEADLLQRRAKRSPQAPADPASLIRLTNGAHRLRDLVLELLDAAQADQGRLVGERTTIDLVACAHDVCTEHDSEQHRCIVEAAGPLYGLYDPHRILQLLTNLVENAVKYSPQGGEVRLKLWSADGCNYLSVTDQGIGIPAEDLPYVFQRFHRGKNVNDRQFAGLGLGLFICRGIVEQHGGRIWVESSRSLVSAANTAATGTAPSRQASTTFYVQLPAQTAVGPKVMENDEG